MSNIIRVENGSLIINDYETSDEEIVEYFTDISPENIDRRFTTSLKVGVVALKTIGTTEKIDYIEKEFYKLRQRFSENVAEALGKVEDEINNTLGEDGTFSKMMDEHLGDDGTLSMKIHEYFGENGIIMKDLFDPIKEGTPLFVLRSLISEEIKSVQSEIEKDKGRREVISETPKKGYEFEDVCEDVLSEIVRTHFGDELERTTTNTGRKTGSFKGDFVIALHERPNCRIVLETKDIKRITLPEIHRTMEESIENRDAKYGIFITKWVESLPKSVGCFNEYAGNHLVCALTSEENDGIINPEILNIAVCWARNRALLETVKAEGFDIPLIQSKLSEIQGKLALFTQIRAECTNVEKAIVKINEFSTIIKDGIKLELNEIRNEILRVIGEERT